MGIIRLKTMVLITASLLVLASITVNQRANLLIYSMSSSELPELLESKWLQDWDPIYPELNLKSK